MNYVTLSEYLMIYFMDTLRERKECEKRILELFVNLRYYYDIQVRAKMFAWNCEVIVVHNQKMIKTVDAEDSIDSGTDEYGDKMVDRLAKPPHSIYGDNQCPDNDAFAQEFFLHAYSIFGAAKKNFLESEEGVTYVRLKDHDKFAKRIISQIRGPCGNINKWTYKASQMIRRINVDGAEVDYINLDDIFYGFMAEFKNQKGAFQKSLEKEFMNQLDTFSEAAPVTFEKFQ